MKTSKYLKSLALAFAVALTACGGGGGGSTGATAPDTNTKPPVAASDLQTTVPTPTYAADSQELAAFNRINSVRAALGYGLFAQNTNLDKGAQNHVAYVVPLNDVSGGNIDMTQNDPVNGGPRFHYEEAKYANFTGVTPTNRAAAAGYQTGFVMEVGSYGMGKGGAFAVDLLLGTVYHRAALLDQGFRDIGIGVGKDATQTTVVNLATPTGKTSQYVADDFVGTYPASGTTGVPIFMQAEAPSPFADVITVGDFVTKTSYPIMVTLKEFRTLAITSFTVTEQGQAAPLDARLLINANDPHKMIPIHQAHLIAKTPFKPATTYNVVINGTNNGTAFSRSFSFTTVAN